MTGEEQLVGIAWVVAVCRDHDVPGKPNATAAARVALAIDLFQTRVTPSLLLDILDECATWS